LLDGAVFTELVNSRILEDYYLHIKAYGRNRRGTIS
jgi:hypothetical protein